jgi:hypothetical protein
MAAIMIDIEQLKDRVYRMLRDIEDGKYKHIEYGEAAGCLSCANTAAMDDFMNKLLGDAKE